MQEIDWFCCRCGNNLGIPCGTMYQGSIYCGDCWDDIMPDDFKKLQEILEK